MATWSIGNVEITKVLEMEKHWPFSALLPGADEVVDDYEWLRPDFVTEEGRMKLFVIGKFFIIGQGSNKVSPSCDG